MVVRAAADAAGAATFVSSPRETFDLTAEDDNDDDEVIFVSTDARPEEPPPTPPPSPPSPSPSTICRVRRSQRVFEQRSTDIVAP